MLHLRTFGGLSLTNGRVDGGTAAGRRPLALLALLAIAGHRGLSRDKVVSMLWPESDQEHGRNSLSQALTALRRDLAPDDLVVGSSELRLNPDAITSDVDDFERCVAAGDLERAAAPYRGPFLDGFYVRGAAGFERWVEEERRRLHLKYIAVLERLARQADARGDRADAVAWWRRLASLDLAGASAAMGLMQALVAAGDRAAALKYFRVHQAVLQQDFGVGAEGMVSAFAAQLRHENGILVSPAPPNEGNSSLESGALPRTPPPANGTARDDASATLGPDVAPVTAPSPSAGHPARSVRWPILVTTAALAAAVAVALIAFRATDRPPQYNPRRVVVTGFVNRTGDSTLDAFGFLAADYITDALQRSGLVEVTDPATSLNTVTRVREAAEAKDEGKEMRLVAEATRAGIVVSGRYSREGDSLEIIARVSDAIQGRIIAATEPVHGSVGAPSEALDRVRERVLGILAVRLDDRLRDVLTPGSTSPPTLAAYREYVAGLLQFQRSAFGPALYHLERAYDLDSLFVAPLVWQVFAFQNIGQDSERRRAIRELAQREARLTPLDRHVLAYFEGDARTDSPAQIAAVRQASALAPGSIWTYVLAYSLFQAGRYDEAVTAFEQVDRGDGWLRHWLPFWAMFNESLHHQPEPRELELEVVREGRRNLPTEPWLVFREARALAALGRKGELQRVVEELQAFPDTSRLLGYFLTGLAAELWSRDDTLYSRVLIESALTWYRALPPAEAGRSELLRRHFAVALYDADHWDEARSLLQPFLRENPRDWAALMYTGLCLAHQGERGDAEEVISRLVAAGDSALVFDRGRDVGTLHGAARIAAALGDRERAVRLLKEARVRGHRWEGRHTLSKLSKDLHALIGYAPYMALTEHE